MIAKTMAGPGNSSWNMSDDERECNLYLFIMNTIFTGMLIVGGFIGNSLAFVVFWKDNMKTSASFLFQSLALVDSAVLLISIPMFPLYSFITYTNWLTGFLEITPYMRTYILPVANVAWLSSIWVVVLLAVNRYIAVCFPFKALRWCTISKVKKQLAFVLLSAVLYGIPIFAEDRVDYVTYDNGTTYKPHVVNTKLETSTLYDIIYNGVLNVAFLVAGPLLTLTYVNIRLIQALKARRRKRMEMLSQLQHKDNNATFFLIIVIVVFVICQGPAVIVMALMVVTPENVKMCGGYIFYMLPVANLFLVLNSAVNFVIYVVFNKRFRHVLARTVGCCSVTEVDGQREKATRRPPRVSVVSGVPVTHENANDSSVE